MAHGTSHSAPGFGKNSNGFGLVIIAAVLVVFALTAWWLWNEGGTENDWYRFEKKEHAAESHADGHAAAGHEKTDASLGELDTKGNFIYHVGDTIGLKLPDGTILRVGEKSTEAKLLAFLTETSAVVDTVDKTKGWITCDRIFFETASDGLTDASKTQIAHLTTILKAFPNAQLKVGGYTDNTGDSATNKKLSNDRAKAVMAAINAGGAANAIAAEGYGPEWPIATNETPEGKAMNRRVDIRVVKK